MELQAVEHIRSIRSDGQPHLLRCSDGFLYIVKFQNNPQGLRVLANEYIASRIAAALGLPVPPFAVITVSEHLVKYTDNLVIRTKVGATPCLPGLCFGSRHIGQRDSIDHQNFSPVIGYLPNSELRTVSNISDFVGMLVFDKWTSNIDRRQVIFSRQDCLLPYHVSMIDNGYCFGGPAWTLYDAPVLGLYDHPLVYREIVGMSAFEPWIYLVDRNIKRAMLDSIQAEVPPEWYSGEITAIATLLAKLDQRRGKLRELLRETLEAKKDVFPNCTEPPAGAPCQWQQPINKPFLGHARALRNEKLADKFKSHGKTWVH
jgi:hypothetical protein